MPIDITYPGVYVEEIPGGVRTIKGAPTSVAAFIGRTMRGPVDEAISVSSFSEFERIFGALWTESPLSYAVMHYFQNGGEEAVIVRVVNDAQTARIILPTGRDSDVELLAYSPGQWGANLQAVVDHETGDESLFNLTVYEVSEGKTVTEEQFLAVSMQAGHSRYLATVLANSRLVRAAADPPPFRPNPTPFDAEGTAVPVQAVIEPGADGAVVGYEQIAVAGLEAAGCGLWALDAVEQFNLLCIPPFAPAVSVDLATWQEARRYCCSRRAMLLVDPPHPNDGWTSAAQIEADFQSGSGLFQLTDENACLYYPWLVLADPLQNNLPRPFAPSGAVAGVIARTDGQKGIWKAPAGLDATLVGALSLAIILPDYENDRLNTLGINCLRSFPQAGTVVWGARTLRGANQYVSDWRYLPVRRLALHIEASIYQGTKWVVFEPNDEPLWAQIRLSVSAFLHDLFRRGAFQGTTPDRTYFVRCGRDTMTQQDIEQGIVNFLVGFAPLRPAEFVIIRFQQKMG